MNEKNDKKEFKNIICPRCGGLIVLSDDKTHGICRYCDSEFLLKEEDLVIAENEAGIERNISGVQLREISRSRLDDYIFQRMDEETSRKYIRYRYREIIENKIILYILMLTAGLLGIPLGCVLPEQGFGWIQAAASFICIVWVLLIAIPRLFHMTTDIKNATGYCEYTFAVLDYQKEMQFICSDGYKLSYKIEESEDDVYEEYQVVLVHVPSIGKIFAENPGRMRRRFSLSELEKG